MKNTKQNIKKTGAFLADNTKEVLYISGGLLLLLIIQIKKEEQLRFVLNFQAPKVKYCYIQVLEEHFT
uniref:hypothetical protein n=1 Tax=Tenacibaculum piscium TaxID=1458515 RepID=UPI001F4456F9